MKQNSPKNSPRYIIAKLLMNSLYGKFGMNPEMDHHMIVLGKDIQDLFKKFIIVDQISLSKDKFLITIRNKQENNDSVNNQLGFMKLEGIFDKAIFLAPFFQKAKVYGLKMIVCPKDKKSKGVKDGER
jgi:hypothetical protein